MRAVPAWAHAPSDLAKQRMLEGNLFDVAWLGAEHMLTGYDHLLFLLGILFFLTSWRQIVSFITAFTIGHTLVLLIATPLLIRANPFAIDAVIAFTVVYKAFENLGGFPRLLRIPAPPLLPMVCLFGLIHGFGLSTRLQDMTLASDPQFYAKIVAFNVGVEGGQIAALAVMAGVLHVWRTSPGWPDFARTANLLIAASGIVLMALQVPGIIAPPAGNVERISMQLHRSNS